MPVVTYLIIRTTTHARVYLVLGEGFPRYDQRQGPPHRVVQCEGFKAAQAELGRVQRLHHCATQHEEAAGQARNSERDDIKEAKKEQEILYKKSWNGRVYSNHPISAVASATLKVIVRFMEPGA